MGQNVKSAKGNNLPLAVQIPLGILLGCTIPVAVLVGVAFAQIQRWRSVLRAKSGIPLTSGEKDLLSAVFGKEINVKKIRKHFEKEHKKYPAYVPAHDRRNIYFCKEYARSNDYSKKSDAYRLSVFMHEATHIWQHQPGLLSRLFNPRAKGSAPEYEYTLSKDSRFKKFGDEQQASIMEDYARRFLYPGGAPYNRRPAGLTDYEADILLQKVVEEKFPAARKTRLTRTGYRW